MHLRARRLSISCTFFCFGWFALAPEAAEAVIWDGPAIEFSKVAFADPVLEENQDRLTDNVWITRGFTRGLYNAKVESSQGDSSPTGTQWAVGTTSELGSLTFSTWLDLFGLTGPFGGPPGTVGADFVVYLTDDDIYLDLRITAWGQGGSAGGSFSYLRSTPGGGGGDPADFDGDGDVDAADLSQWQGDYGLNGDSDFDNDGDSDGADFLGWQKNYTGPTASVASVPEPQSLCLLLLGLPVLGRLRLGRRSG